MFTATKWEDASAKEKFVKQFMRFVESDFSEREFPKWFYDRLHNTFGHIALYDRGGFYSTYFTDDAGKVDFLHGCLEYPCYGDPEFTYSDAERVIQALLIEGKYSQQYEVKAADRRRMVELAEYERLRAKFAPVSIQTEEQALRKAA